MEVEKDGPSITYEAFVGDLDEGDSFTTSLVDVLVKVRYLDCRSRRETHVHKRNWPSAGPDRMPWIVASSRRKQPRACVCKLHLPMYIEEAKGHFATERDAAFPSPHLVLTARSMIFSLTLRAKKSMGPCSAALEHWKERA